MRVTICGGIRISNTLMLSVSLTPHCEQVRNLPYSEMVGLGLGIGYSRSPESSIGIALLLSEVLSSTSVSSSSFNLARWPF